jgi:hypothetical protein
MPPAHEEGTDVNGRAASWSAALEAIETDVEELDRALSSGATVVLSSWQPPSDLGPVPPTLVPRARRLVERIAELRSRGQDRLAALRGELEQLDRRRDAGVAYSAGSGPGPRPWLRP